MALSFSHVLLMEARPSGLELPLLSLMFRTRFSA